MITKEKIPMQTIIPLKSRTTFIWLKIVFTLMIGGITSAVAAESLLVKKQVFQLDNFKTINGKTIKQVKIGWESYGKLNAAKDNVILITHFFSGTSHAAGKYQESDPLPGYWDAIIGHQKAVDTNKYFVISTDTLVNANAYDPNVITTGPASINPDTNKPYGLDFPVVTIRDFVKVQKQLLDSLGIKKLHAVMGASMGAFQALEWSVAYPVQVERMISVIGAGKMDAWTISMLEQWALPIRLDKNWNNGNYYDDEKPAAGLIAAFSLMIQNAMYPTSFNQRQKNSQPWAEEAPRQDIRNTFQVSQWLAKRAAIRTKLQDANHILYLVRACQLFIAGHNGRFEDSIKRLKAKTLFLPAKNDLLLFPAMAKQVHEMLKKQGGDSQYEEIVGDRGHLDGLFSISQKADTIKQFLSE
jgi:homoserine O-acetyltransferase